ncbi:MAG: hypothetical protein M1813_002138 [Trichoglossum hirsutum]|nr:MAG: hypothetical protein M1813_002138 [Trichoglossum hirsutum]
MRPLCAVEETVPRSCYAILRDLQSTARLVTRLDSRLLRRPPLKHGHHLRSRAKSSLDSLQRSYTQRVEAAQSSIPESPAGPVPLILAALERLIEQKEETIGLLRYIVCLEQLPPPPPEPTSGSETGEAEQEEGSEEVEVVKRERIED